VRDTPMEAVALCTSVHPGAVAPQLVAAKRLVFWCSVLGAFSVCWPSSWFVFVVSNVAACWAFTYCRQLTLQPGAFEFSSPGAKAAKLNMIVCMCDV
jgi:hypothetical protein